MAWALRSSVPLNSRCSRKWLAPARASGSSRDPVPAQNPTATERSSGMASVTTRSPLGRRVRRTGPPSDPLAVTRGAGTELPTHATASATRAPAAVAATPVTVPAALVAGPAAAAARRLGRAEIAERLTGRLVPAGVERHDAAVARR